MWWLSIVACWFSRPAAPSCDEPHLWYAPDSSGDVYFGCDQPPGWLATPPDEESFAIEIPAPPEPEEPDPTTDPFTSADPTGINPPKEDTGLSPEPPPDDTSDEPEETGLEEGPRGGDTGEIEDRTGDTGELPPETGDTGDTADLPPEETGLEETGLPPAGPTGDTGI